MAARDLAFMRRALTLARRGFGHVSPNPMVGAVLVRNGRVIGRGWHRKAGEPHAEIEAIRDAQSRGLRIRGASLYVTLEPCCTHGRTPPCTEAIVRHGIGRVVVAAVDPNPAHAGRGLEALRLAGVRVTQGVLESEAAALNESFNHWIVHGTPWVTVKAAMTLDGKIATVTGESKWITGEASRARAMTLRMGADAILVGINTVLADDPSLTVRAVVAGSGDAGMKPWRRIILDSKARMPLHARVVSDDQADRTTVVVSRAASKRRVALLRQRTRARVITAPVGKTGLDLNWLLKRLGREGVTSLLVEGGGEVNASFLMQSLAHRVAFFYAPKIVGGRRATRAVGGEGVTGLDRAVVLQSPRWEILGDDVFCTARVASGFAGRAMGD